MGIEIYYALHIIIFAACLFEFTKDRDTKRYVLLGLMLMVTLFGGLRWKTGGDWDQYYLHFKQANWNNIFSYHRSSTLGTSLEPLFVFANVLAKEIFGTFWMYNLCVVAFIQYTYYRLSLKFSPKFPIVFYAFLMIVASNYFPVRAGFSLAVAYHAYPYLQKRNWKMYFLFIFLAFMIHRQCIVLAPLYFVSYIKKWVAPITISAVFALFVISAEIFHEAFISIAFSLTGDLGAMAQNYTEYVNEGQASKTTTLSLIFLNILFLLVYLYVMKVQHKENDGWYKTLLCGFLAYAGFHIVFKGAIMGELTRLANLFVICHVILFTNALNYFFNQKSLDLRFVAIAFFVLYYAYRITKVGSGFYFEMSCLPYRTIFDYHLLNGF